MKVIYLEKFGSPDVLQTRDVTKPVPGESGVLVRVKASSVNYGDLAGRKFNTISPEEFNMPFILWLIARLSFGLTRPNIHILGSEFSGIVEAIGNKVTRFKNGDSVFGYVGATMGGYAEYIKVGENDVIAAKPDTLSFEEAAVVPYGAIMAIHFLRRANVRAGQKVLVIGASGGIGSAAVQIARSMGAEVTGICGTPRVDFVKSLGATRVIDYNREDFTRTNETYDLIFDVLGRGSIAACNKLLKTGGIHLCASFKMKHIFHMLKTSRSNKRLICAIAPGSRGDLMGVKKLIETGKIKAVIDKAFPMEEAADAHRYAESGNRVGQIAIQMI